jgi:CheY-like chemotaxis protein/HPt (histidine-containing phosphotransfer) domain-containing protein
VRIRQILINLINNAIKFTAQGSVTLNVTRALDLLRFEIRDTGIGISPEVQARLFNPFVQADGSTTREFGGTGLGLSICKNLVELMGGTIGVDSEAGKGSTFWFTLPLEEADAQPELPQPHTSEQNSTIPSMEELPASERLRVPDAGAALESGTLILLVEDNAINQKVATLQLHKLGFATHAVENGQVAVEALETLPYGLVLMDCQMPVMDGFEATHLIRKSERESGRHIPIIAMTANAMQGDRERCLQAGMDDYLSKPINPRELSATLARWMPGAKSVIETPPSTAASDADMHTNDLPIELKRLQQMFDNDMTTIRDLLQMFVESLPDVSSRLETAIKAGDMESTYRIAHEMKGSCSNMGAAPLADMAKEIESMTRVGQMEWSQANVLYGKMPAEIERIRAFFRNL